MIMAYKWVKCYACGGSGIITYEEEDDEGEIVKGAEKCGRCDGSGYIEEYDDSDKY
jgi:DnaJ-class molecular chaperone